MRPERVVRFTDERLADGTVYRRYEDGGPRAGGPSDGRVEWRSVVGEDRVAWRDAVGGTGTDERLGRGIVKRTSSSGVVAWGRDQGYGRTAWEGGRLVTINATLLDGRAGALLAAAAGVALLGGVRPPPKRVSAAEEQVLRDERRRAREERRHGKDRDGVDDLVDADDRNSGIDDFG